MNKDLSKWIVKSVFLVIFIFLVFIGHQEINMHECMASEKLTPFYSTGNGPLMLAQLDTGTANIKNDPVSVEKLPINFTLGYSAWYASFTNKNDYGSGSVSGFMSGPSASFSFGRWSLSGSFLFNTGGAFKKDFTETGFGYTDQSSYSYDRYECDLVLRRSYGSSSGKWLFGPQFGFKYFGIKNDDVQSTLSLSNGNRITTRGEGGFDAYGPTIGGVLAFIPGNPQTSPITISLIANIGYLYVNGKDPRAYLYDGPENMRRAGYNPSIVYPGGVNIGTVPSADVNKWGPAVNATIQMSYNIIRDLNVTAGVRYNWAEATQDYVMTGDANYPAKAWAYFEYWGGFLNLAYSF